MKKLLCFLLTLTMLATSFAFAAPVGIQVEGATEIESTVTASEKNCETADLSGFAYLYKSDYSDGVADFVPLDASTISSISVQSLTQADGNVGNVQAIATKGAWGYALSPVTPLVAGTTYYYSFDIKTSVSRYFACNLYTGSANVQNSVKTINASDSWQTISGTYVATISGNFSSKGCTADMFDTATFAFGGKDATTFYLDNFELYCVAAVDVADGEDFISNGGFENGVSELTAVKGTTATTEIITDDVASGSKALKVTCTDPWTHLGLPVKLTRNRTYDFSFDIKLLSDRSGNAVSGVTLNVNVFYPDSKASQGMSHVVELTRTASSTDGWTHYSGSYTPASAAIASDATPEDAKFALYFNPINNINMLYIIDNVSFTRRTLGIQGDIDEDFEDSEHPFGDPILVVPSSTGWSSSQIVSTAEEGYGKVLEVTQGVPYGQIGILYGLTPDYTYNFSYDIRVISDYKGNGFDGTVSSYTDFMFADANSTHVQKYHHLQNDTPLMQNKWTHVSGEYSPSSDLIASDSTPGINYFNIFVNSSNKYIFQIDNVKVTKHAPLDFVLPGLISDNMLVQQNKPISIWGKARKDGTVTAKLMSGTEIISEGSGEAIAGQDFEFSIPQTTAGGPYTLEISLNESDKVINNVLVGELWSFAGQSNMQLQVKNCGDKTADMIPSSTIDSIRYFRMTRVGDGSGTWTVATPENVRNMAAVAFTALERMNEELNIPVGGIDISYGGKSMAAYTGPDGLCYKIHIAHAAHMPIAGHMWYQGESDGNNTAFAETFYNMLSTWYTAWGSEDPIIFVQLQQSPMTILDWGNLDANGNPTGYVINDFTTARTQQADIYRAGRNDGVGMVTAFDTTMQIDELKSVENPLAEDSLHQWNKKPIGQRLGNYALATIYGKDIQYASPMIESAAVTGKNVVLTYSDIYSGLSTTDGKVPACFELAGDDGVYYKADSVEITSSNTIELYSNRVANPKHIGYAIENHFVSRNETFTGVKVNLVNSASLPAIPEVYNISTGEYTEITDAFAPVTSESASIRTTGVTGLRFKATVNTEQKKASYEYGFVVALTETLGDDVLTLDYPQSVSGKAYSCTEGIDKIYDVDESLITFTGVLYGIPTTGYSKPLTVRPYIRVCDGTGDKVIYGSAVSESLYEIAKSIIANPDNGLNETQLAYINSIISAVEN